MRHLTILHSKSVSEACTSNNSRTCANQPNASNRPIWPMLDLNSLLCDESSKQRLQQSESHPHRIPFEKNAPLLLRKNEIGVFEVYEVECVAKATTEKISRFTFFINDKLLKKMILFEIYKCLLIASCEQCCMQRHLEI